jgi:hypothetical protein
MITSNPLWKLLKKTIDGITTESLEKAQVCIGKGKLLTLDTMEDGYADDIEVAGTGLLAQKAEGAPMATDDIIIGGTKRYIPKTMAKKVSISEEAMEDNKYVKALQISKRLVASAYKTQDIDVASLILNAASVTGGYDGVALASTAHVLPTGAHACNYLGSSVDGTAIGATPSPQAVQMMRAQAALQLGPNGIIDSLELTAIVCPETQRDLWKIILGTDKAVGSNYNDINTVADYGLKLIPVKWFDAVSTSVWCGLTNADDGLKAMQKRKITSNTWVDNDGMVAHHGVSYRMAQGWSNWRCIIMGNV